MATRPKAVIESRDGEELSPITITKNVLTDDGQNLHDILSDRKEDMMTPTIENSSSMFKVGQGDNVDYSENVVNGAYEGMVLKGKTMVNCIQESSSQDVVLPYEFADGQYVTINDTKESGALGVELKGETLVNLVPSSVVVSGGRKLHRDDGSGQIVYTYKPAVPLKPNTVYTCFVWLKDVVNPNSVPLNCSMSNRDFHAKPMTNGLNIAVGTTKSELGGENCNIRIGNADVIAGARGVLLDAVVVEGDYSSIEINPFYGMASCKMPILHSIGKNLIPSSLIANTGLTWADGTQYNPNSDYRYTSTEFIKIQTGVYYTSSNANNFQKRVHCYDKNKMYLGVLKTDGSIANNASNANLENTFKIDNENVRYIRLTFYGVLETAQLEQSSTSTAYEPYKSSILSLPEEVVLRSLPNGVKDTLNLKTGEYVQRIGEVTLTGGESFVRESNAHYNRFKYKNSSCITQSQRNPINSNTFVSVTEEAVHRNQMGFVYGGAIYLYSPVGSTQTVEEFKIWLQDNPTTIQYQLAKPVVTKINLPSMLKSWNTTTHIYSEIPENSLYPILSHLNPTYPVILKPSTKYSIVANSYSNGHTNSTINFNLGGATTSTTVGNRVTTITTPSTLSNELLTMSGRGNKLNNVMVIEGDVVGDEPYFEGICDCKSPILSNVGKNLFNGESRVGYYTTETGIYNPTPSITQCCNITPIQVSGGTKYSFLLPEGDMKNGRTSLYDSKMNFITSIINADVRYVITTTQNTKYINFHFDNATPELFSKVQLEESSSATSYEPYKSNILSCETYFDETTQSNKTIVLRSLPNGVCDTLNVETREYVQRIGEVMFDGSENWTLKDSQTKTNTMLFQINSYPQMTNELVHVLTCEFVGVSANEQWGSDIESISLNKGGNMGIRIKKTKLQSLDVTGFKQYLQANPITVQYELATPIVTTIDVQGFPYAYTNGHVQLSSGSIEQSLTPKVEYSVVTNRNGQIRSNQKMVERHQKQLDRLQAMILTNLVNTQYEQTLTNLKYDLKNVREEVK